ncbi:cyclic nucleotide-binding domain protein (macronuclear) [Tetrahymena thermophila SB210]|uniref:Cyclic nucleotide-binding domain protein n=1 Tax=Tetrahymena thermophila (strain SB210) TaxID=312017 RepID=X1W3S1_TETTS|nr:cyclic nucleotide-binding domain protein [Tetrahymena thermophila SB210]EAS06601.3 cyclic nucleotide-binding domain protein [Tetrahymena thermophila SB210]|eukprot:XP_001026846.3 cyclic nucleotide-binding domain protein [Tetrahymena thermophila SB210]
MAQEEITFYNLDEFLSSSFSSHKKINIEFRWQKLGDEKVSCLFSAIEKCTYLTHLVLDLSNNKIGEQGASNLGSSLAKCINLQSLILSLDDNKIGNQNVQNLGLALKNLKNISILNICLNSNQIGFEGIKGFSSALQGCTNLIDLTFTNSNNNFGDQGLLDIGSGIADCISIKKLTLSVTSNQYKSKSLAYFGQSLSRGKFQILDLYVGWDIINQEDIIDFGSYLANCTQLKSLYLSMTGIGMKSEAASGLISALSSCKPLQNLVLCLNYNEINDVSTIGSSLIKFQYLQSLHIDLCCNPIFVMTDQIKSKSLKLKRLVKRSIRFF